MGRNETFSFKGFFTWSLLVLALALFCFQGALGVSVDEDITLSSTQKNILDQFRELVESQLPHKYMKEDIYLIRWLRARNFNIELARTMLFENLEWRKKNNMDTIHDEDWSDYIAKYKLWYEGVDKQGRPIAFLNIGSWDLRRAILAGEKEKMLRYLDRCIDLVVTRLRQMQDEGKNVSQVNLIVNLAGYTVTQQGCLQCIQFYISFVSTYETRYPGIADKIILLNTPGVFEIVLNTVRPLFSPKTREALKIFGTNRQQYAQILFSDIDRSQLPVDVGGTDDGEIYKDFDDNNGLEYLANNYSLNN